MTLRPLPHPQRRYPKAIQAQLNQVARTATPTVNALSEGFLTRD